MDYLTKICMQFSRCYSFCSKNSNCKQALILTSLIFLFPIYSFAGENIFYILHSSSPAQLIRTESILKKLQTHARKINIIISQAYTLHSDGVVSGFVDENLIKFTHKNHIKLLALATNSGFDKDKLHRFLSNKSAQKRAIGSLLAACKQFHYDGMQFDFEGISLQDQSALTEFYSSAAKVLHEKGYIVSFAVVPATNSGPHRSELEKRRYENWSGAYDLKILGQIGDFVSLMAYDQHGQGTLPGPIGGYNWIVATLKHALRKIPANKLSLGIPVYSGYWAMPDKPTAGKLSIRLNQISHNEVKALQNKYNLKLKWDEKNKTSYALFEHNWLYEYLFVEDVRAFKVKRDLAKKFKLRGISVFRLGNEDPGIWKII